MKEAFEKMTGMPDAWTNPALMVSRNAFIQGWEARAEQPAYVQQEYERVIYQCPRCATSMQVDLTAKAALAQPAPKGFLGEVDMVGKFVSDVKANFFDEVNRLTDEEILDLVRFAKAQQEDDADATIIQYHEATIKRLEKRIEELAQPVQEPWCMKMNVCKTKCDDCPDEPAQEPVSVTYKEVADAMNSLWNGTLEQHQIAEQMANKKLYTTPQQRPWVGLTEPVRTQIVRKFCLSGASVAIAVEAYLKEKNA
jgi:hypothetical protein